MLGDRKIQTQEEQGGTIDLDVNGIPYMGIPKLENPIFDKTNPAFQFFCKNIKTEITIERRKSLTLQMAVLCDVDDMGIIEQFFPELVEIHWLGPNDQFGFVLETESEVFVVFFGCRTAYDWFCSLDFRYTRWFCGWVHYGFSKLYRNIARDLFEVFSEIDNKKSVYLTGHSKGGALAVLASTALLLYGIPISLVCTFGAPKVGDSNFWNWLEFSGIEVVQIIHRRDPFTDFPPSNWQDVFRLLYVFGTYFLFLFLRVSLFIGLAYIFFDFISDHAAKLIMKFFNALL